MPTFAVQAAPLNQGSITVRIFNPTNLGTPLNETATVSYGQQVDRSWEVDPGIYSVSFQWTDGYQNIHNDTPGNFIKVDGVAMRYQVLGSPGDQNGVQGIFTFVVP